MAKNAQESLIGNAKEFLKEAELAKGRGSYNSSVTLYFKAIAVITDLFILKKEGFIPSNHNERFRLLEAKYPLLYRILDKNFPTYQQSYRIKLTKAYSDAIENDLKEAIEFTGIRIEH